MVLGTSLIDQFLIVGQFVNRPILEGPLAFLGFKVVEASDSCFLPVETGTPPIQGTLGHPRSNIFEELFQLTIRHFVERIGEKVALFRRGGNVGLSCLLKSLSGATGNLLPVPWRSWLIRFY